MPIGIILSLDMKKNKKTNSFPVLLFFLFLIFWIIISVGRTFYNVSKVATEEKVYIGLSDTEKRIKIFGDKYKMILFVKDKTNPSDNIIFYVFDTDLFWNMYFLNIYYLYPRKVVNVFQENEFRALIKTSKYQYGVIISRKRKPYLLSGKYKKIGVYSGKEFTLTIYKLQ